MKPVVNAVRVLAYCLIFSYVTSHAMVIPSGLPSSSSHAYCSTEEDLLQQFCVPVSFTRTGVQHFLHDTFSHTQYPHDYLAHSFAHLVQFLEYGTKTNQRMLFFESSFRLFLNKIKASRYISCYAVADFTACLPELIKTPCAMPAVLAPVAMDTIKNTLYDSFLTKFQLFKSDVDLFFEELSDKLTVYLQEHSAKNELVNREQLRQMIVRFLEVALLKTMWPIHDQTRAWGTTKTIAQNLAVLMQQDVISKDELDDLYHSLLESFCRFIDLFGTELSDEALEVIKKDVCSGNLLLFSLEEQEEHLQTKRDRVMEILVRVKARRIAENQGLVLGLVKPT